MNTEIDGHSPIQIDGGYTVVDNFNGMPNWKWWTPECGWPAPATHLDGFIIDAEPIERNIFGRLEVCLINNGIIDIQNVSFEAGQIAIAELEGSTPEYSTDDILPEDTKMDFGLNYDVIAAITWTAYEEED